MPRIIIDTIIDAPAATCFGLIRDELVRSEGIITGRLSGEPAPASETVELGQFVTFENILFGFRQSLTVEVVEFESGRRFVDAMVKGTFKSFRHTHEFHDDGGKTLMRDILEWTSPFGILGRAVDTMFLKRHLRKLVTDRNSRLKVIAESGT